MLVTKAWFLWIPLLLGLGIGGCITVFVTPRLRLPIIKDIQLFPATNPLENWDLNMQDKFDGIKENNYLNAETVPAIFVWGFDPKDDRSKLDPDDDIPPPVEDKKFDFYSKESQTWLIEFTHDLLNQSWLPESYRASSSNLHTSLEVFASTLDIFCAMEGAPTQFMRLCCSKTGLPFEPDQLQLCGPIAKMLLSAVNNGSVHLPSDTASQRLEDMRRVDILIFSRSKEVENGSSNLLGRSNKIAGLAIKLPTTFKLSFSYETMDDQYHTFMKFLDKHQTKAPPGMRGVFFFRWRKDVLLRPAESNC